MTAAQLQALAAVKHAETLLYQGLAEQARLTGLTHQQTPKETR